MPIQEFLASYAVRVDEDGARRLQRILRENRTAADQLAMTFSAARDALASLKAEMADLAGFRSSLAALNLSTLPVPRGSSGSSGSSAPGSGTGAASVTVPSAAGSASLSVSADLSAADEALAGYKTRAESLRPKLSVNTSGITSAVSSAIASVRSMMSSLSLTIPVRAQPSLDLSNLAGGAGGSGGSGSSGSRSGSGSSGSSGGGSPLTGRTGNTATTKSYSAAKTLTSNSDTGTSSGLAVLSVPAAPGAAVSGLSGLLDSLTRLTDAARSQIAGSSVSGAVSSVRPVVEAPVNISVTASAASPEAIGRQIYDTAARSLLKTLEGVFA